MTRRARGRIGGWIVGTGMVLVVSGCNTPPTFGEPEETFGAAVRHNIAVQTVNPDPQNKLAPPAHDAARAAGSMERYRTDKVKKPVEIRTSGVGGGK
jgi:type IV pilus biogenesis protein CpaD/CtpE